MKETVKKGLASQEDQELDKLSKRSMVVIWLELTELTFHSYLHLDLVFSKNIWSHFC